MQKYRNVITLILILSFAMVTKGHIALAQQGYQKVSPMSVSPKPDVIQDKEFRERSEDTSAQQSQASATEQKEIKEPREEPPLISGEPSKVHYQISVNDKLYIGVWRVRDLSLDVIVGPDGKISFPLIGDIDAAGRTLSELDWEITEKLKVYVIDPQVSVMVKEFSGDRLAVIGEVKRPGVYKFVGRTKIMDIIALAGGFTDRAKQAHIVIVRESSDPDEPTLISAHIKSVLKGDVSKNIEVEANDIVYVSRTFVSHLKEFYNDWIDPIVSSAVEYQTLRSLRRSLGDE